MTKELSVRWEWSQELVRPEPHIVGRNQQGLALAAHWHNKLKDIDEADSNVPIETQDNLIVTPRSIWSFGPFVMSVGILVSVLLKLLCAPYCAKCFTDFLRSLLQAQLQVSLDLTVLNSVKMKQLTMMLDFGSG